MMGWMAPLPVIGFLRPGGKLTGAFILELEAKRLQVLHELVPTATVIGILANPNFPDAESQRRDLQAAAQAIAQRVVFLDAANERDIDAAFASLVQQRAGALLVASDPFLFSRRDQIVALAARHGVPCDRSHRLLCLPRPAAG
jgi:ABC-type uncharacterized transport system substrate-binding protein